MAMWGTSLAAAAAAQHRRGVGRPGAAGVTPIARARRPRETPASTERVVTVNDAEAGAIDVSPSGQSQRFEQVARKLLATRGVSAEGIIDALTRAQRTLAIEAHVSQEQRFARAIAALRAERNQLAIAASHDSLTGVLNRAGLLESLRIELLRAVRYGRPFSVLFIDLDRFKEVNDAHGHAAGDAALRRIADATHGVLRPGDVLGRYGGEEFVVGLVDADVGAARRTAERLRRAVAYSTTAGGIAVTASVGVAARRGSANTVVAILDRADAAMYAAKRLGRNQVCVSAA